MAAHVSSPSISIRPDSPLRRPMGLLKTCFASLRIQKPNPRRINSEEHEKMQIASLRYLAKRTGLMWCSNALAPSPAYKWQSMYGKPLPYSPVIRSTDVVLGTFAHPDGDHRWEGDAYRNGDPQHFPPTLGGCSARSGYTGILPLRKYISRSTRAPRLGHFTKP